MSNAIHPFSDRETAFLKYEPIELNGLVYYPIRVADYSKWQALKPVLCLRQGTLPAVFACMTYLQCVWALDSTQQANGYGGVWDALASIVALSLRLSDTDMIQAIGNSDDYQTLSHMRIVKGDKKYDISPMEFNIVRKLIADQNGADLPDEADNPDLIEAAEDIANSSTDTKLNCSIPDMLTSVASAKNMRRADILEWPVKEFDDEMRALKRRYGFFLSSIAESQGAKFTKGNPYPTWIFDKEKDEFAGLISMEQLQSDHRANFVQSDTAPITNQKGD